jgi:hypothetical protein
MMNREFRIAFWNPYNDIVEKEDIFGCSVYGYATNKIWAEPDEKGISYWDRKLTGTAVTGNYKEVLKSISCIGFTPEFCLILFNKAAGMEDFIRQFQKKLPQVPLIGGGASRPEGQSTGKLCPQSEDVAVLAVAEGNFSYSTINIYNLTGISVEVEGTSPREFERLRVLPDGQWLNALDFYRTQQAINEIDEGNFESLSFTDDNHRNLHCSIDGKIIRTGADLPNDNRLHLALFNKEYAEKNLAEFMSSDNSLVFGCAGIRSLIREPLVPGNNSLAGFLFGELYTINDQPMFGNLMFTKLTYDK